MTRSVWKRPSAWLPIGMSLTTVAMLFITYLRGRLVPQPDEGTEAHLFQILMAGQLPIVAWFVLRWVPRDPLQAVRILTLQIAAAVAAMAPVWYLGL